MSCQQSAATGLGIHPELLGAAAHLHARALELEVGVDAHAPRARAGRAAGWQRPAPAARDADSTLTSTPPPTACRSSGSRLPGPAKLISCGQSAPASSATCSSPAEATSMPLTRWPCAGPPPASGWPSSRSAGSLAAAARRAAGCTRWFIRPVVGIERRLADARCQAAQRLATDQQLAALHGELRHRHAGMGAVGGHVRWRAQAWSRPIKGFGQAAAIDLAIRVARQRAAAHLDDRRHHVGRHALLAVAPASAADIDGWALPCGRRGNDMDGLAKLRMAVQAEGGAFAHQAAWRTAPLPPRSG